MANYNEPWNKTHGGSGTALFKRWAGMRYRCSTKTALDYPNYGGRGITVCEEWEDFATFRDWALANGYEEGLTIERFNNNGNYDPGNCRWVPKGEQARNRRNCVPITILDETKIMSDWLKDERCSVSRTIVYRRLRQGWDVVDALFTPSQQRRAYA